MGLIGNSRELTLADLVQMKAHGHGTCRIQVQGPQGTGALLLSGSRVVHAEYAGAVGRRRPPRSSSRRASSTGRPATCPSRRPR